MDYHYRIWGIVRAAASTRGCPKSPDSAAVRLPRFCQPERANRAAGGKTKGVGGIGVVVDEDIVNRKITTTINIEPNVDQSWCPPIPLRVRCARPSRTAFSWWEMGETRQGHPITHSETRGRVTGSLVVGRRSPSGPSRGRRQALQR